MSEKLVDAIPTPEKIRERISEIILELKLLRQLLGVSERKKTLQEGSKKAK